MTHTIGLVVPFAEDKVPDEGLTMYPGINFVPRGTGVRSLTPQGYDAAIDKIVPAAEDLARKGGVEAVMVLGTSLTFYRGPEFHDELLERVKKATGLPCSTMSKAVADGLDAVGAKKIAVSTAYSKVVNDKLIEWLKWRGFEVQALESFGFTDFLGPLKKSETEIIELTVKACAEAPAAEGVLISCGGLRTLNCADPIEKRVGLPVVTSTQSAFWAALGLVGESGRVPGYGRMLAEQNAPKPD